MLKQLGWATGLQGYSCASSSPDLRRDTCSRTRDWWSLANAWFNVVVCEEKRVDILASLDELFVVVSCKHCMWNSIIFPGMEGFIHCRKGRMRLSAVRSGKSFTNESGLEQLPYLWRVWGIKLIPIKPWTKELLSEKQYIGHCRRVRFCLRCNASLWEAHCEYSHSEFSPFAGPRNL